jgi:hypothetical protein
MKIEIIMANYFTSLLIKYLFLKKKLYLNKLFYKINQFDT